jgi:hypothetical protein
MRRGFVSRFWSQAVVWFGDREADALDTLDAAGGGGRGGVMLGAMLVSGGDREG